MRNHTGIVYSGELLDWGFNWSAAIPSGDSISASDWELTGDLMNLRETVVGDLTACWTTGYEAGKIYDMTNHVVLTPSGRKLDQTLTVYCLDSGSGGGVLSDTGIWSDGDAMVWDDGDGWLWVEVDNA